MQLAWLTVRLEASIIIEAIGDVRVFLQLKERDTRANRMYRPSWHEDHIASGNLHSKQEVLQSRGFYGGAHFIAAYRTLDSVDNLGSRGSVENIPGFRLA